MRCLVLLILLAAVRPATRPFDDALPCDARIIYGLATLDFSVAVQDRDDLWVLGRVNADQQCRAVDSNNFYVTSDKLQATSLPGSILGRDHQYVVGNCSVLEVLRGTQLQVGQKIPYAWAEPPLGQLRESTLPRLAHAFTIFQTDDSEVLVRVNPSKAGAELLSPFVGLPPNSAHFVAAAITTFAADRALFDPSIAPTNADKLKLLLSGENPILGCIAAQTLAKSGRCLVLANTAASTNDFRKAVFVTLAILNSKGDEVTATTDAILNMVKGAKSKSDLNRIAEGAWAVWGNASAKADGSGARSEEILRAIRDKARDESRATNSSEYLFPLFQTIEEK